MRRTRASLFAGIVAATLVVAAVPAAFAARHTAQGSLASCVRSQLGVRANGTTGAAGTIHGAWVFTNLSGRSCTLYGYPGMQLYSHAGRPMPTTVKRSLRPRPTNVTLAPGGSATFFSSYNDVQIGTHPCPTSEVAQITPPNAVDSLFIPAQLKPCGGIVNVSAVKAGVHHAH